jgi:hypothetical protein
MKDKTRVIILCRKEQKMLERVKELKLIQCELNNLKRLLEIKSGFLKDEVRDYKALQVNFQMDASDKNMKIGKQLEFYDYPKLVFKVDGEDIFSKPACVKDSADKEEK